MTIIVLKWEHKPHCAFLLGSSGEEASNSFIHSLNVLVDGAQCPEVPQHPGSCRWQFHNMYKVRRMPQVLQIMAKIPRSSRIYQTSTANKQHLTDNVRYTTHKVHSYVSLRNQDCKHKLQNKFKSSIWLTASPLAVSELHHPTSTAFSAVTKTDLTEPPGASRPTSCNPDDYGRG